MPGVFFAYIIAAMAKIIDIHTHAFPDALADRAMKTLAGEVEGIEYYLDGRVSSLLDSMNRAGIDISVVSSIATRPTQFEPILNWSQSIQSDRIISFPSVHPGDPDAIEHIRQIKASGFAGLKMHPYYQDFTLDDPELTDLFREIANQKLLLLMHTGFDIAFEYIDRAGPQRILNLLDQVPDLKLIITHMGGWQQWEDVTKLIIGKKIFLDISYSFDFLGHDQIREMILSHPEDYVLFGTDSPWADQSRDIEKVKQLNLPADNLEKLLGKNAEQLLRDCF